MKRKTLLGIIFWAILLAPLWGQTFTVRPSPYADGSPGVEITGFSSTLPTVVRIPPIIDGVRVRAIGANVFSQRNIIEVIIPNTVTHIGNGAFARNQLTSVTIPNNVTHIGNGAFSRNQLTSVTIPNNVTHIGDSAFSSNQLTTLTIPNSVTYIGDSAFEANQLTSVTIPDSVTIRLPAFRENRITSITIGANVQLHSWEFGNNFFDRYNSNGRSAGTYSLENRQWRFTQTIQSGTTAIEARAFRGRRISGIDIPDTVTNIGNEAFRDCQIEAVTIPGSVTAIGDRAFAGNPITSISIGANVQLHNRAFDNNFTTFYNRNSRSAGTYTFANRQWTFTPE